LSKEVLLEHQQKDVVIRIICEWLRDPKSPPEASELCAADPEIQALYAQRQSLELVDGILCRNFVRPDASIQYQQVVVPRTLRTEFIQATHAGAINGHFGVEKSREKLKQVAYWRGWAEDVRLYVLRCLECNQYRHGPRQRQGQLQKAAACAPMQKVHCDLVGPFVASRCGYKCILTVICAFTRYLITVPIRDKTSLTVAKALIYHVYLVHGPPEILVHVLGGEFWSAVMTDLAKLLEIQVSKISSHRPQSNGVCERIHATMHFVFAKVVANNQRNWCDLTPYVTYAYNTATHSASSLTPYYLLHLRHPRAPIELMIEKRTQAAVNSTEEYVEEVAERMRLAYSAVRHGLKASFERCKRRCDARVKTTRFQEGDMVFYYVPRNRKGLCRKWSLDNRGPYRIQRKLNDVNYIIQRSPQAKPPIVHIDRITKYHGEVPANWKKFVNSEAAVDLTEANTMENGEPTTVKTRQQVGQTSAATEQAEPSQSPLQANGGRPTEVSDQPSGSLPQQCVSCDGRAGETVSAAEPTGESFSVSHGRYGRGRRTKRAPPYLQDYVNEIVCCVAGRRMAEASRTTSADKVKLIICCEICGEYKKERAMRRHVRLRHTHDYKRNEPLRYVSDPAELEMLRNRERRAQKHKKKETETKPRNRRGQGNTQDGRRPAESQPPESTSTERFAAGGHRGSEGFPSGAPPVGARPRGSSLPERSTAGNRRRQRSSSSGTSLADHQQQGSAPSERSAARGRSGQGDSSSGPPPAEPLPPRSSSTRRRRDGQRRHPRKRKSHGASPARLPPQGRSPAGHGRSPIGHQSGSPPVRSRSPASHLSVT